MGTATARRLGRGLLAGGFTALVTTSAAIFRDGRARPLQPAETALLFGAAVWSTGPSRELECRSKRAAELYARGHVARIICAGGNEIETEAMRQLLLARDVPEQAIVLDPLAEDSRRALRHAAGRGRDRGRPLVLVSSPTHMHRLLREARRLDLPVQAAPASLRSPAWRLRDRRLLSWQVRRHLREVLAIWWYALPIRPSTIEAQTAGRAAGASARLATLTAYPHSDRLVDHHFAPPVDGVLTSGFGWRSTRMHEGVDFAVERGAPVWAAAAGAVLHAGELDVYGKLIAVGHADGSATVYGHLDEILTVAGAHVASGEQIGLAGSSGNAFGPHLHFEVRVGGRAVDPLPHLRFGPGPAELRRQPAARMFVLRQMAVTALRRGLGHR